MASILKGLFGGKHPWYADLCDRYGVTPEEALALGTRAPGRRPDLPAGQTCLAVTGMTLEEIWSSKPRDSQEAVEQFYQDAGTWFVFRQAVRNRRRSWAFVDRYLPWDRKRVWIMEYGCGIAPCAAWLFDRRAQYPAGIILADVPSEHLDFGAWRLKRRIEGQRADWISLSLPLMEGISRPLLILNGVVATEVLEHVPDPPDVIRWLAENLVHGGMLVEDFHPHGPTELAAPWDLAPAQTARPAVYAFLREHFELIEGRPWDDPDGGGTRVWRKLEGV